MIKSKFLSFLKDINYSEDEKVGAFYFYLTLLESEEEKSKEINKMNRWIDEETTNDTIKVLREEYNKLCNQTELLLTTLEEIPTQDYRQDTFRDILNPLLKRKNEVYRVLKEEEKKEEKRRFKEIWEDEE